MLSQLSQAALKEGVQNSERPIPKGEGRGFQSTKQFSGISSVS